MNGKKACDHEGGYTPFDCEVTSLVHDGGNFVVIYVNNQRKRDGVPTLNTDWWNYGGLTRDVSLIETPEIFVDDYSLQLQRGDGSTIAGWVHVVGAGAGMPVTVKIPELNLTQTATTDAQGRAAFSFKAPEVAAMVAARIRSSTRWKSRLATTNSKTRSAFAPSKRKATTFC